MRELEIANMEGLEILLRALPEDIEYKIVNDLLILERPYETHSWGERGLIDAVIQLSEFPAIFARLDLNNKKKLRDAILEFINRISL